MRVASPLYVHLYSENPIRLIVWGIMSFAVGDIGNNSQCFYANDDQVTTLIFGITLAS